MDGAGSGLDADLLDGQSSAFFQNAGNLNAGTVPAGRLPIGVSGQAGIVRLTDSLAALGAADGWATTPKALKAVSDGVAAKQDKVTKLAGTGITDVYTKDETNAVIQDAVASGGGGSGGGSDSAIQILDKLKTVDGGGSGLDADLLDGQSGEFFLAAENLTGTLSRDHLPAIEKDPAVFGKTDTLTDAKLFARANQSADMHAQKLVQTASPFNANYEGGNISAFHVRHVAEGTNKNGPRGAGLGASVSMFKEGFGTGQAKGGEIDGVYIVVRQDSPRDNSQGINDPNRGDACGILIDAAVYEQVGFVGGIEGATTVLSNVNGASTRRLVYQLGCTDTTTTSSIGLFTSAALGSHSAGLLIYGAEGSGGSFDNYIQCRTDTVGIFNVDRGGTVSMGRRLNNGQMIDLAVHMAVQSDFSLAWLNANKSAALLNLDQNGNLSARGGLAGSAINSSTNIQAQGNIIAGGKVSATLLRLTPGTAGSQSSELVAGTFSVGQSGRPRFCLANGQAPVFLATTTA
ncbi:hypothetical protein ACLNGM_20245 [Aureimonas phyllosphaerae]|uniref:hypothetical protein n=1 Tax=Aureimonas phyllosphaerae TaxID=1166078 RepID=UPI003A5BE843